MTWTSGKPHQHDPPTVAEERAGIRTCPRCGAPELEETIPITDGLCALCVAEDEERVASEEARG